jgi:hypothetical protein
MKLAGQGDGRDRARIFVITCRLVGRRPWFSGKGTASDNAACYNGAASFSGRAETQATKRRHTAIASRFKSCGLAFSQCPLCPGKRTSLSTAGIPLCGSVALVWVECRLDSKPMHQSAFVLV